MKFCFFEAGRGDKLGLAACYCTLVISKVAV